ncbi:MAG: molecular chaperone HtpG [Gammaproteobacteria bacterium]|nr:molecular chaperone HtpG [Gammaproteobacteria bacterium]
MSVETGKQTLAFQAEVQQLLHLMIHSLYGNREIFLRELISNASDAADRLRFEALRDDTLFENDPDLKIRVEFNKEQRTISVIDNGIGMSRQEVIDNLGTIAKSGSRQFFEALSGDQARDSRLIGQFGVGFYSSLIVAGKVEVVTRRAGLSRGEGVRWITTGQSDFTVETLDRPKRGTRVTLYLRDGEDEFLDGFRLRTIIRRYSDHISLPIVMDREEKGEKGEETVNSATALWTRNKRDIQDSEYREFYKHVGHDFDDPIAWTHSKVEGKLEYTSLLFIPSRAPFNLWDREQRHGIKLYVKRVFIMDDAEQLLPPYLRFVRGVVDSDDLPLNISREILQQNKIIDSIRSGCTRKVVELLEGIAANEPDTYATIWKEFGRVLKEGVIDSPDRQAEFCKLFRFASTARDDDEQAVSLQEYVDRMKQGQKAIYYITSASPAAACGSPHLEIFREQGVEVLLLTDPVDEWLAMHVTEFDGKPLQSVAKGRLDLGELQTPESGQDRTAEEDNALVRRMQDALGDKVKEIRLTHRLTSSPACLVAGEHDMSRHLQKILQATGQEFSTTRPILEINPRHPLIRRLLSVQDADRFADWSHVVFDQALLSEGGQLPDVSGFVRRLNNLLLELAAPKDDAK